MKSPFPLVLRGVLLGQTVIRYLLSSPMTVSVAATDGREGEILTSAAHRQTQGKRIFSTRNEYPLSWVDGSAGESLVVCRGGGAETKEAVVGQEEEREKEGEERKERCDIQNPIIRKEACYRREEGDGDAVQSYDAPLSALPSFPGPSSVSSSRIPLRSVVLVKPKKVGGTTLASILRRVGKQYGLEGDDESKRGIGRGVWARHGKYSDILPFLDRSRSSISSSSSSLSRSSIPFKPLSLLLTIVRRPGERCMSQFYHSFVSKRGINATAEKKLLFLRSASCSNYLFKYLCLPVQSPVHCLDNYDFVALQEHFEESLVVLQHR